MTPTRFLWWKQKNTYEQKVLRIRFYIYIPNFKKIGWKILPVLPNTPSPLSPTTLPSPQHPPPLTPLSGGFRCRTSPMPLVHNKTNSEGFFFQIYKKKLSHSPPSPLDPPQRWFSLSNLPDASRTWWHSFRWVFFGNNENMFYLPPPLPLWTPPKGGYYSPQTPNVSESVVALSEDSFPAKKKSQFFGQKVDYETRWSP